jgi:threonyl-tRNA synthetase
MCLELFSISESIDYFFARPFWLSPRQVLVIPVAAPYVGFLHLSNCCYKLYHDTI